MEWSYPFVPWIGGLLALGCLLAAFRNYRRKRLSEALPTSRALGVFMGLVEQIPDRLVSMLTVMRRFELLSAQDFERAAVKVEFIR